MELHEITEAARRAIAVSNACALCGLPAVAFMEIPVCYRHTELSYTEERKAAAIKNG